MSSNSRKNRRATLESSQSVKKTSAKPAKKNKFRWKYFLAKIFAVIFILTFVLSTINSFL